MFAIVGAQGATPKGKEENPMRKIFIGKLVLNICIGDGADRLTRAGKVLEELTGQDPVFSRGTFPSTVEIYSVSFIPPSCRPCSMLDPQSH